MEVTFVVARNLMDLSKVREAAKHISTDIQTCSNFDRLLSMLNAGPGDRRFKIIIDYSLYEDTGLENILFQIGNVATLNEISDIEFRSFVPHEKLPDLKEKYPEVKFVPRSKFFADLTSHLA
jgi:hypothetical protein